MFTTRTQVVDYLVSKGHPEPLVKALVTEYLNHDAVEPTGIIWRPEFECDGINCIKVGDESPITAMVPVQVNEAWCDSFYTNQVDMVEISDDGLFVLFDGECIFDFDGKYLPR